MHDITVHRHAAILAGGSGTRLWPASRAARPKQLLPVAGGMSLLAHAWHRADGIVPPERRLICTTESFADAMRGALGGPDGGHPLGEDQLLLEPAARDTLNAIGLVAHTLAARDPHAVFAVLTADHLIEPAEAFRARLREAFELVEADHTRFVTFGVTPTHAATGYGYIERGAAIEGSTHAFRATRFTEKPERMRAEEYLRGGNYLWNSGMFVFHAQTMCECLAQLAPVHAAGFARIAAGEPAAAVYPALPRQSIDRGVMEPAAHDGDAGAWKVCVLPLALQWLDVGSWPAYAATVPADDAGNRSNAHWCDLGSRGMTVISDDPDHLVATVGCEDLVIVHTTDATLVCPQSEAERVKELVERIPGKWR